MDGELKPRILLFVDDVKWVVGTLRSHFEDDSSWEIAYADSPESALEELRRLDKENSLPSVVSIDLGLPPEPRSPRYGLQLLRNIRDEWDDLDIIVHSQIQVKQTWVLEIARNRASYIYLGSQDDWEDYRTLLRYVAKSYMIWSYEPASNLNEVLNAPPDPFQKNPDYWNTMELLDQGNSYNDIAKLERVQKKTIMKRVKRMISILEELDELAPSARHQNKTRVIGWYRDNSHRRAS